MVESSGVVESCGGVESLLKLTEEDLKKTDEFMSIPSMIDGLNSTQRKILFSAFEKNLIDEIEVDLFSCYVLERTAYHLGEQSIQTAIVGMAQNFVGTNNINLLSPIGRFGTRERGGKDAASPRYIYTKLSEITRLLFPKEDDILLDYMVNDGFSVEPSWYMPVIPLVLVNGFERSGTGWSTFVPSYDPRIIIANVRHLLDGEPLEPMTPWYHKFKGKIEETTGKESGIIIHTVSGVIEEIDAKGNGVKKRGDVALRITELPIRTSVEDYQQFLYTLLRPNGEAEEGFIKDFMSRNTNDDVHFEVILSKMNFNLAKQQGLLKSFKLTDTLSTTNMYLFDENKLTKYESPQKILERFYELRLKYYNKRKEIYLEIYQAELVKLENQIKFINGVMKGEIDLLNRKKAEVVDELRKKNFMPIPKNKSVKSAVGATEANKEPGDSEEQQENAENHATNAPQLSDYDYLFSLTCESFTSENLKELRDNWDGVHKRNDELRNLTAESLWRKDLATLEEALDVYIPMQEKGKRDEEEASARRVLAEKHCRNNRNMTKAKPVIETVSSSVAAVAETENPPHPAKAKGRAAGAAKKVNSAVMEITDAPEAAAATKKRGRPVKQTTRKLINESFKSTTTSTAVEYVGEILPEKRR